MPKKTQLSVTRRRKALFNENDCNIIPYITISNTSPLIGIQNNIIFYIIFVTVLFSESGEKNDDDLFSFLSLTLNIIISMPFLTASRIHYNNISLLKLMMSCPNLFMKRWSVVNISSGYTSLVGSKRSPEFLTLQCTHILKLTFFWHFNRRWSFFVNNSRHWGSLILKYV